MDPASQHHVLHDLNFQEYIPMDYDSIPEPDIIDAGDTLVDACHSLMVKLGWWTDPSTRERLVPTSLIEKKLLLIHSEISEAAEGHRKSLKDDKLPHRSMLEVELADAVIRICDLAGALGLDLGSAIAEKLAYNAHRPDHKLENRVKANGKSF
jgi:NTP pyrophosphatase (non-canonical NTP hydrolase)